MQEIRSLAAYVDLVLESCPSLGVHYTSPYDGVDKPNPSASRDRAATFFPTMTARRDIAAAY